MKNNWEIKIFIKEYKEKIYKYIIVFLTIIIALISVAFYIKNNLSNNIIDMDDYQDNNSIAAYINGEEVYTFPSKDDGYVLDEDKSYCDNADLVWDSDNWILSQKNITKRTKCYLYFELSLRSYVTNLLSTSSEVIEDETDDKNIRYIGENPNNYIWFNCYDYSDTSTCERWRIIGLMNNVPTDNGTQSLIKIIRADQLTDTSGNSSIYWDYTTTGEYYNIWDNTELKDYNNKTRTEGGATLRRILNGAYYGTETVTTGIYSSSGSTGTKTYTYSKDSSDNTLPRGITTQTLNKIEKVNWNVTPAIYNSTALTMYNTTGTSWEGYIGLMDPADYGFATSGGGTGRSTCLGYNLYNWYSYSDCYSNSWIRYYNPTSSVPKGSLSSYQWTIRPSSGSSYIALYVVSSGLVHVGIVYGANSVRPTLYLSSKLSVLAHDESQGSYENPYLVR